MIRASAPISETAVQTGGRPQNPTDPYQFISLDPPSTTACAALAMRHFGPPERPAYLEQLRPEIERIVTTLLDQLQGQRQIDLVDSFAYPAAGDGDLPDPGRPARR